MNTESGIFTRGFTTFENTTYSFQSWTPKVVFSLVDSTFLKIPLIVFSHEQRKWYFHSLLSPLLKIPLSVLFFFKNSFTRGFATLENNTLVFLLVVSPLLKISVSMFIRWNEIRRYTAKISSTLGHLTRPHTLKTSYNGMISLMSLTKPISIFNKCRE